MSDPRIQRLGSSEAPSSESRLRGRATALRMPRRGLAEPIAAGFVEDSRPGPHPAPAGRRWSRARRDKPLGAPGGQPWPSLASAPGDLLDQVSGPAPFDPGCLAAPPLVPLEHSTASDGGDEADEGAPQDTPARLVPPAAPRGERTERGRMDGCAPESSFLARFAPRDEGPVG